MCVEIMCVEIISVVIMSVEMISVVIVRWDYCTWVCMMRARERHVEIK